MATKGRPPHFKTPQELEAKWIAYKEQCKENGDWLEKTGFVNFLNVYHDLLTEYKNKPAFSDILGRIDNECKKHLLEKGLKNEYNSAIVKLIASANYGMSETQKVDQKISGKLSLEQVIDQIEEQNKE